MRQAFCRPSPTFPAPNTLQPCEACKAHGRDCILPTYHYLAPPTYEFPRKHPPSCFECRARRSLCQRKKSTDSTGLWIPPANIGELAQSGYKPEIWSVQSPILYEPKEMAGRLVYRSFNILGRLRWRGADPTSAAVEGAFALQAARSSLGLVKEE
jgi:hypothetical protein